MPDKLELLRAAIEDVVRRRFSNINILRVEVSEGEDHDGEPAVFVRIVFDGRPEDFDPAALTGITRHLRARLHSMHETRFPYTRFVSRDELDGVAA